MSKLPASAKRSRRSRIRLWIFFIVVVVAPTIASGVCIYVAATWKVVDAGPATISHPVASLSKYTNNTVKVTLADGQFSTVTLQNDAYYALRKPAAHSAQVEAYINTSTDHVVTIGYQGHHYGANSSKGDFISAAISCSIPFFLVLSFYLRATFKRRRKQQVPTFDAA